MAYSSYSRSSRSSGSSASRRSTNSSSRYGDYNPNDPRYATRDARNDSDAFADLFGDAPATPEPPRSIETNIGTNKAPDTIDDRVASLIVKIQLLREDVRKLSPFIDTSALDALAVTVRHYHPEAAARADAAVPILPASAPAPVMSYPDLITPSAVCPTDAQVARETPTYARSPHADALRERFPGFSPSEYQLTVFDFVVNGFGDGMVNAVAGSGKTTTLTRAAALLSDEALFCAFNKHIAEELVGRLRGTSMTAMTIHSIGSRTLAKRIRRTKVDGDKYRYLIRDEVAVLMPPFSDATKEMRRSAEGLLRQLVSFTRLTLTDPNDPAAMRAMCDHYGIDVTDEWAAKLFDSTSKLLAVGADLAERAGVIDFDDMVYLPHRWGLTPTQFKWVFVDECQDLNAAQKELVLSCRAPGGRILFVGDPNQSLYGFAGADSESFWRIQQRLGAVVLPLSVCYRCPASVVRLAKDIVPQIESMPNAPEGVVGDLNEKELMERAQDGDLILCRLTAPLISQCMRFIAAGKTARVRGRDIGKQLADVIRAVEAMPGFTYERFGELLAMYEAQQTAKLAQRNNAESALQTLADKVESVRACYENYQVTSTGELIAKIEGLFSDVNIGITLCTVHRAKGLEFKRVFIVKPEKLPLTWPGQQDWEAEQEMNLKYVAITRAQEELYFVRESAHAA